MLTDTLPAKQHSLAAHLLVQLHAFADDVLVTTLEPAAPRTGAATHAEGGERTYTRFKQLLCELLCSCVGASCIAQVVVQPLYFVLHVRVQLPMCALACHT